MASYDKIARIRIERYPTYEDDGTMHVSYGIPDIECIDGTTYSLMGYSNLDELFKDLKSVLTQEWSSGERIKR